MSFIAAAAIIGTGAAVGGGLQFYGASQAASAAREGAQTAADAALQGGRLQYEMFLQAQRQLSPFVNLGTAAGGSLANMVVSPEERKRQFELQRADLQAEVDRLSRPITEAELPPPPGGKNSSERWAATAASLRADRASQLSEAQSKLNAFNTRSELELGQLDARQAEEEKPLEEGPYYKFQRDLGERNIKRQLSATGRLDTGFGAETLSNFYRALGAEETERQFVRKQTGISNLFNLTTLGANAGAQQASNFMQTGNAQQAGLSQYGQLLGTGTAQAGQITGAGIQGIGNTIAQTSLLAGAGLAYMNRGAGGPSIGSFQDQAYSNALQQAQATGVPQTYFQVPGY